MLSAECEPQIPPLGLKSSVGMTNLGGSAVLDRMTRWQKLKSSVGMTERKAKSERRRAKGEERKAKSEQRALLLLNRLDCLGMDLLVLDLRSVPASAERLDQVDRRDHLLAEELRRQPLVGQQRQLCGDAVEVARDSADVAVVGNLQSASGIGDGGILSGARLRERVQSREPIFNLLERAQHGLAIVCHRLVVGRFRGREIGAVAPALEDRLQKIAAQRPDGAGCGEQVRDVGTLPSTAAGDGELRSEEHTSELQSRP